MGDPAKRRATYEDLLAVPENLVAEIIHGVLITHPRPGAPHTRAASRLGGSLDGPFDRGKGGPGGWVILSPSTAATDCDSYVVAHVWRDSAVVRAEPFDAIELELEALWAT